MNTMIEQIYSIPDLIRDVVQPMDEVIRKQLKPDACLSLRRLFITGCGDSHHAAIGSELAFERLSGIPTEVLPSLQMGRYTSGLQPIQSPNTHMVIGISVSGAVARTCEALHLASQRGMSTLALTASPGSRITTVADISLLATIPFFREPFGVRTPGVRTYLANQLMLLLIATRLGEVRGHLSSADAAAARNYLKSLSEAAQWTIDTCDHATHLLARDWVDANEYVFVGSGPNYGTALFSAAKILEASGDSATGQETEEWCHLQYFARERLTPTFFISAGGRDLSRALEAATAAQAIGRRVVVVAPNEAGELHLISDRSLPVAQVDEMFSPIITSIPGELYAAYRADVIGEPFFRNFKGGRSVEGGGGISRIRTSETWTKWKD